MIRLSELINFTFSLVTKSPVIKAFSMMLINIGKVCATNLNITRYDGMHLTFYFSLVYISMTLSDFDHLVLHVPHVNLCLYTL